MVTMPLHFKYNEELECHSLTKYRFVTIKYTFDVSKIFITHAYIDTHLAVNEKHASILRLDSFYIFLLFWTIKLNRNSCEETKKLEKIFGTLIIIKQLSSQNIIANEIGKQKCTNSLIYSLLIFTTSKIPLRPCRSILL